jgi:hypothetical protein
VPTPAFGRMLQFNSVSPSFLETPEHQTDIQGLFFEDTSALRKRDF